MIYTYSSVQFDQSGLVLPQAEHIPVGDGDLNVVGCGLIAQDKVLQVQDEGQSNLSVERDIVLGDVGGGDLRAFRAVGELGEPGLDLLEEYQSLGRHVDTFLDVYMVNGRNGNTAVISKFV